MKIILAAILFLSPHLDKEEAAKYAKVIHTMSKSQEIDPFLIVSIIRAESNFSSDKRSKTNDMGLMQIHVSRTTFPDLRGHEKLLYNPTLNIYLGVKHLRMFRKWHLRKCKPDHLWWRHYKWGYRQKFPNRIWAARVQAFYQQLVERFRDKTWRKTTEHSTPTVFQGWFISSGKNSWSCTESCLTYWSACSS